MSLTVILLKLIKGYQLYARDNKQGHVASLRDAARTLRIQNSKFKIQ